MQVFLGVPKAPAQIQGKRRGQVKFAVAASDSLYKQCSFGFFGHVDYDYTDRQRHDVMSSKQARVEGEGRDFT